MAENFQDNVKYSNSTLAVSGDAVMVGSTNAGAKSVIFNNSGNQGNLAWQPTANRTINLPDAGGTIQLTGQVPGAIQAGTQTATSGTIIFSNSNGVTFGMSNSSVVTASYTVPSTAGLISAVNFSAGTTSNNLSAVTFSNSNGLAFGLNGSTITGSYTVPTQTNQTEGLYAIGNTTGQSSSSTFDARTVSVSAAGSISAGYSGGALLLSVSQTAQTQNVVVPSAGTQTATSGTVIFSNSNGISFGMSNSSVVTASYTVPTQTNQTVGLFALGNTTQNSSTTLDARSLSFNGLGIITAGYSNGSIQISATQSNQTEGRYAIGNTTGQSSSSTFDARTLSVSGAGGVSVGYSGNALVISGGGGGNINVSAGTTSNNLTNFVLSNSNNVSFGLNGSTVTATASFSQTNQTVGLFGLGNTTQNSSTTLDARSLSFNGLGIVTVGYSNGSIQVSATQSNQTEGMYAIGNTAGQSSSSTFDARTLSISGAGIASVGYSGNALVVSVPSAGASINVSAGTTSNNLGAVVFSNSNNVSFGLGGSTVTASAAQSNLTVDGINLTLSSNGSTITLSALYQTIGVYGVGNTTGQSSSSTVDIRSLSFDGAGVASVGFSGGSVVVSVPSGGGGGTASLFALGNTTQNSSTSLDIRSLSFNALGAATMGYSNGSIQVSAPASSSLSATGAVSISTNGSTISIGAPAAFTKSIFYPYAEAVAVNGQHGIGSLHIHPVPDADNFQFDRMVFDLNWSHSTSATTGTVTISMWAGLYTRNVSTLSLFISNSTTQTVTYAGANSNALNGGKIMTMGWTTTVSKNDYWLGIISNTSSSGNASVSVSQYLVSNINSTFGGLIGVTNSSASNQYILGLGYYSSSTTGVPNSIAFSSIIGAGSSNIFHVPIYKFLSQTA